MTPVYGLCDCQPPHCDVAGNNYFLRGRPRCLSAFLLLLWTQSQICFRLPEWILYSFLTPPHRPKGRFPHDLFYALLVYRQRLPTGCQSNGMRSSCGPCILITTQSNRFPPCCVTGWWSSLMSYPIRRTEHVGTSPTNPKPFNSNHGHHFAKRKNGGYLTYQSFPT